MNSNYILFPVILNLFAGNTNVTTDSNLSNEMKTYYSDYLIDLAEPKLVHDQFAQKHPIPKNGGKQIEFRKYDSLPTITTPLTEGVTPDGQKLKMSVITSEVKQYGGYVEISDMLILTAIDNNIVQATKLLAGQAGRTSDTITREVLAGGTNVMYAGGKEGRSALTAADKLTVKDIRKAVRFLKLMHAEKIGDSYVAIIHPDVSYDLMDDPMWEKVKDYDPKDWYDGEIGRIAGVRFVENSEAKTFKKGEGGATRGVYATMIFGADAYGVTEIEGGGLQHFVKQLGSAGTADPLNQRATVGWKLTKTAERLVEQYMIRIESCSSFDSTDGIEPDVTA